jgi:hypothetical protein
MPIGKDFWEVAKDNTDFEIERLKKFIDGRNNEISRK